MRAAALAGIGEPEVWASRRAGIGQHAVAGRAASAHDETGQEMGSKTYRAVCDAPRRV